MSPFAIDCHHIVELAVDDSVVVQKLCKHKCTKPFPL